MKVIKKEKAKFSGKTVYAYTLIEILVVLSIIGVLFGVAYASYRDFSRRQELAGVAKTIQGNLRRAQQNALSGVKPPGTVCNSGILIGYDFYLVSNKEYQIRANCTNGNVVVSSTVLSEDSSVLITSTNNPILFNVLGNGTNIADSATITVTHSVTGETVSVYVGSGGDIE